MENIFPIFDHILKREEKEHLLNQKGTVVWLLGLSGSGKSTLARALENSLHQQKILTQLLDGDNLRVGVNNNLGFSEQDRQENLRRAAEVARLFANCGIVTICSFISPTHVSQQKIKSIVGKDQYYEVFIDCPVEVCEERDVKGLYAKARRGEIPNFTGISAPFEEPEQPNLVLPTHRQSVEECTEILVKEVLSKVQIPKPQ